MRFAILALALLVLPMLAHQAGAQSAYYIDEQGMTLSQNYTTIAYNITAIPQVDANGIGPGFFITGVSNTNYMYEEGIGYNWYGSGTFTFVYSIFGPNGQFIGGNGYGKALSASVYPGDKIVLYMYFSKGSVIMIAKDLNTSAYISVTNSAYAGTKFLGNPYSIANKKGYFTGAFTIWPHIYPYSGKGTVSAYQPYANMTSPVRIWISRTDGAFYNGVFSASNYYNMTSPKVGYANQQVINLGNLGSKFYAGNFMTGNATYSSLQVTEAKSPSVTADANSTCSFNASATVTGGIFPYNYTLFLENAPVKSYLTNSTSYTLPVDCADLAVGRYYYFIQVSDSNHESLSAPLGWIYINQKPQLVSYSVAPLDSFFFYNSSVRVAASLSEGSAPYKYSWYIGNALALNTTNSSLNPTIGMRSTGKNALMLVARDSAGTAITQLSYINTRYNYLHIAMVIAAIIVLIALIVSIVRQRLGEEEEYYYYKEDKGEDYKLPEGTENPEKEAVVKTPQPESIPESVAAPEPHGQPTITFGSPNQEKEPQSQDKDEKFSAEAPAEYHSEFHEPDHQVVDEEPVAKDENSDIFGADQQQPEQQKPQELNSPAATGASSEPSETVNEAQHAAAKKPKRKAIKRRKEGQEAPASVGVDQAIEKEPEEKSAEDDVKGNHDTLQPTSSVEQPEDLPKDEGAS